MEAFGILKFWRNSSAGDEDDSFFDLVLRSPLRKVDDDEVLNKDFHFIESPRDVFTSNNNLATSKPSSPAATLLRSTPKFKIFMLGFRKSTTRIERDNGFTVVKCRDVGKVPDSPALARDNSLRSTLAKEIGYEYYDHENFSDVVMPEKSLPMYLKLIKPFYYVKALKKTKLANSVVAPSYSPVTVPVPVNFSPRKLSDGGKAAGNFKIVVRSLGKSRSASGSGIGMSPAPPIRRRDDSLLEQHDGIQGAILHCKNSYNSSSSKEYSRLYSSHIDRSCPVGRNPCEDQKRCSI